MLRKDYLYYFGEKGEKYGRERRRGSYRKGSEERKYGVGGRTETRDFGEDLL